MTCSMSLWSFATGSRQQEADNVSYAAKAEVKFGALEAPRIGHFWLHANELTAWVVIR